MQSVTDVLDVQGFATIGDTSSPPSNTTDRLYNNDGDLFWDGVRLNTGVINTMLVTAYLISDGYNTEKVYYQTQMRAPGRIIAIDSYCADSDPEPVHSFDLRINGTSVFESGKAPIAFVSDTYVDSTSDLDSSASEFESGDMLTVFFPDGPGGYTYDAVITITVQYD